MTNARNENKEKSSWKKALLILLCLLLLVGGTVMGTMAYLTHTSNTVENVFYAGNVKIELWEKAVEADGKSLRGTAYSDEEAGVTFKDVDGVKCTQVGNEYKLIPGNDYVKEAFLKVNAGSEKCYLFVKVNNGLAGIEGVKTIESQLNANHWVKYADAKFNTQSITDGTLYYLETAQSAGTKAPIMESFTIKPEANNTQLEAAHAAGVNITGYAVQYSSNFSDAKAAWDATFGANAGVTNIEEAQAPGKVKA